MLAILGVAAGLVIARGAWHSDMIDVRAAADEVAASLRTTRAAAFRTGRPRVLRIDTAHGLLLPAAGLPVRLSRGVSVARAGGATTMLSFVFEPNGACNGGSIVLSEGRVKRLVTVDFLSGRISVGH